MTRPLLEVRDLRTRFRAPSGASVRAVDGVSFAIPPRATIGIVGESGCGKSATALSLLRLIPPSSGHISGQALYHAPGDDGAPAVDLLALPERALRPLRGDRIAMIFQEPMTSLNPVLSVGSQVGEVLRLHRGHSRAAARAEAARLFQQVGIADPEHRARQYPHQLSGGMRQRVMIAMAIACHPDLLIADEPTTALDVTIQAQILDLLGDMQGRLGMSILLITHDLGVVAQLCQQVVVMYAGQVVEQAPAATLFSRPRHPYTAGLLRSLPRLSDATEDHPGRRRRLQEIPGLVPRLIEGALPPGCRFQARCPRAAERCAREPPPLGPVAGGEDAGALVRCHFPLSAGEVTDAT